MQLKKYIYLSMLKFIENKLKDEHYYCNYYGNIQKILIELVKYLEFVP